MPDPNPNPNPTPDPAANPNPGPAKWLEPFGEHGKAFESFKEPAELATKWTELNTELTTLKGKTPPDWRAQIAGDDPEALKALGRFTDPKAFYKSFNEAQTKIRAGELAKPLGKDATPEQIAEYRQANGIPNDVKGYFEKLPQGLVIGKEDQPMFDAFGKIAHEANIPPAFVHAAAKWYYDGLNKTIAEERAVDQADSLKVTEQLRNKYGADYEANMSILDNWLDGLPQDVKGLFKDASLGDGTRLFNSPEAMHFLISQARTVNPVAHLIPAGGNNSAMTVDSEIAALDKLMRDRSSEYWKGPKAEKNQARYRDLITARDQMKRKAG
jgi:hypothetical protein